MLQDFFSNGAKKCSFTLSQEISPYCISRNICCNNPLAQVLHRSGPLAQVYCWNKSLTCSSGSAMFLVGLERLRLA